MSPAADSNPGWDNSAAAWMADMGATGDRGDPAREFVLDPAMRPLIAATGAKNALDVGCGEGRLCRMMAGMGIDATGLDPTSAMLDAARDRDPDGTYVQARAEALPFPDESFDLVVTCLSLIDIEDAEAAIAEMARVLRPGGTLLAANLNSFATALHRGRPASGSAWIVEDGVRKYFAIDDYMDIRANRASWRGIDILNWHRPLSHYMAAYLGAGLILRRYDEPEWQDNGSPPAPRAKKYARMPWFNLMVWEKPAP